MRTIDDDPPIKTKAATQEYRDNWDRIFGNVPEPHKDPDEIEVALRSVPGATGGSGYTADEAVDEFCDCMKVSGKLCDRCYEAMIPGS